MPTETISPASTPRFTSSRRMTSARRPESSLLWAASPRESVWPETSNLKFFTPAPFSFFLALTSALTRFFSFASQGFSKASESVLKTHWFLRPSSRSFLLTAFSAWPTAAPPAVFLAMSQACWAAAGEARARATAMASVLIDDLLDSGDGPLYPAAAEMGSPSGSSAPPRPAGEGAVGEPDRLPPGGVGVAGQQAAHLLQHRLPPRRRQRRHEADGGDALHHQL